MARPKGSHDLIPMSRGAFKRALAQLADKGIPLSDIFRKMIEEDPFRAFDLMIKLHPKEMQVAIEQTVTISANEITPDLMREAINARRAAELPDPADTAVH